VIRWATKHPLLAYFVWAVAETFIYLSLYHMADRFDPRWLPAMIDRFYFRALPGVLTAAVVLALTLLRLRVGLGRLPIMILPLLVPLQTLLCWGVVWTYWRTVGNRIPLGEVLYEVFISPGLWQDGLVKASIQVKTFMAAGAVVGGFVIAHYRFRTGCWETITPVDRHP